VVGLFASRVMLASALMCFQQGDFTLRSSAFGKTYVSAVSEAKLLDSPAWADDKPNPPVSARSAMNLARIVLDAAIELPEDCEWHQGSLHLMVPPLSDQQRWIWLVYYYGSKKTGVTPGTGSHKIALIVLMDGTVVKPKLESPADDDKKSQD